MEGDRLRCIEAIQIHSEGVAYLLSNIYPEKSHGPDNLPVLVLKEVSSKIAPVHTFTFQASLLNSLDQTEVSLEAVRSYSYSVFKKGRHIDSYRPTLLTCVCTKVYWNILFTQIMYIFKHLATKIRCIIII